MTQNGERGTAAFICCASMSVGSYVLPTILTAFRAERPQTHINLTIREPEAVLRAVEQGECDFGISVLETPPASPNLLTEVLGHEEIVLVAAPTGCSAASTPSDSPISKDIPLIIPPVGTARRHLMEAAAARRSVLTCPSRSWISAIRRPAHEARSSNGRRRRVPLPRRGDRGTPAGRSAERSRD